MEKTTFEEILRGGQIWPISYLALSTKNSTHHSLSADTGFKSLAIIIILFEIQHLQNCYVKFQIFQRAITHLHQIIFSLYSISC